MEDTQRQLQETQEALQDTQKKLEAAEKSLSDMRDEMAQIKTELSQVEQERDQLKEECSKLQDKPETSETVQTPTESLQAQKENDSPILEISEDDILAALETEQTPTESLPQKEKKKPKSHADELITTMFVLMCLVALAGSIYTVVCQIQGTAFWDLWLMPMGGLTVLGMCYVLAISTCVFACLSVNNSIGITDILLIMVVGIIGTAICGAFILLTNGITAGILALIH